MVGKKIVSFLSYICALLIIFDTLSYKNFTVVYANKFDLESSKERKQEIKSEKNSLEKALTETQKKIDEKCKQYEIITKRLQIVQEKKEITEGKINSYNDEINKKLEEIQNLENKIKKDFDDLKQRFKVIYKSGEDFQLIDLLLGVQNIEDLIDASEVVSKMSEYDSRLLNSLKHNINLLNNSKKDLEQKKNLVESEKQCLARQESDLQVLIGENENLSKDLVREKGITQSEIDQLNSEDAKIQSEISRYYEEEAQKKSKSDKISAGGIGAAFIPSSGGWLWPVPNYRTLSSPFCENRGSYRHKGIDISGAGIMGKPVYAAESGTVIIASNSCVHNYGKYASCGCGGGFGNYVAIVHDGGKVSKYGHLSTVLVSKGQKVVKGQQIGTVGSTGQSTGPHLHYQLELYGTPYNPLIEYK